MLWEYAGCYTSRLFLALVFFCFNSVLKCAICSLLYVRFCGVSFSFFIKKLNGWLGIVYFIQTLHMRWGQIYKVKVHSFLVLLASSVYRYNNCVHFSYYGMSYTIILHHKVTRCRFVQKVIPGMCDYVFSLTWNFNVFRKQFIDQF